MSSLLALAAEKATQGYKLLSEAEALCIEAYSLVPKMPDSVSKMLVMSDLPPVIPSTSSEVLPSVSSPLKQSRSVDDAMLIPASKIHHVSTEGLKIPEVWPQKMDPSYIGLESKHYYECQLENCTFTSSGKAAMWSHVAQTHTVCKASCPLCSL